jgi:uncharacterized Zn finger protein
MTAPLVLADGKPITISGGEIGSGPWSRLLATSIVPEPRSARAQRGRELAEEGSVHTVAVATGHVTAKVTGSSGFDYDVELHSRPLPPRVWAAAVGSGREFAAAAAGREQSVRLEHELAAGWGEPLVPQSRSIRRSCTCPDIDFSGTCKHVVALAYVFTAAVDEDPELLLRWRGVAQAQQAAADPVEHTATPTAAVAEDDDPWLAGEVPVIEPPRPLPVAAVLKRLGPSGLKLDGVELIELLEPAYAALARTPRPRS